MGRESPTCYKCAIRINTDTQCNQHRTFLNMKSSGARFRREDLIADSNQKSRCIVSSMRWVYVFCWSGCLRRKRSGNDEAGDVRILLPIVTILYPHIRDRAVDAVSVGALGCWTFYGDGCIDLIHDLEFAPTGPAFPNSDERHVRPLDFVI